LGKNAGQINKEDMRKEISIAARLEETNPPQINNREGKIIT
jgi:hypothetical protein